MAGSKGGKGGAKGQPKAGATPASTGAHGGSVQQQQQGQGEEARRRREDLIRRYLLQRLQAAEAEAAAAGSSAGSGERSSSGEGITSGEGGSRASAASAAAFLQLLNETSVRQSDVRLAIRRAAREQGIPQKKAKLLESVEARLARNGPILYQNASITAGTAEWQQGRVKEKERCTADSARFEGQLDFFELKAEAATQKLLDKARQPGDSSPLAAAAAAMTAANIDIKAVKISGLRGHPSLYPHALPLPSELDAPPATADAAAQAQRRMQRFAGEALEELDMLRQVTTLTRAGVSPAHLNQLGGMFTRCHDMEVRLHHAQQANKLAEDVREAVDPALWAQRMSALLGSPHRELLVPLEVMHELDEEAALLAAVRGHLLMQLQTKAAAQGWSGAPAELQRGLLPLALLAEDVKGEPSVLTQLLLFACSEAKVDAELPMHLLGMLITPYGNLRGLIWRVALLLLPLLAAAPPLQLPAALRRSGSAAGGGGEASGASAAGGQPAEHGDGQAALPLHPPHAGPPKEAAIGRQVQAAAAQLATPERQSTMVAAIMLALARMQLRRRLYDDTVLGLVNFIQGELDTDLSSAQDLVPKLGALPPDSLLLAYSYVAIMFGRSFAAPDELGPSVVGMSRIPSIAALGAADFTLASHLSFEGALAWEPLTSGGAASDAQLRLRANSVETLLHARAAEKQLQQQQQQQVGQPEAASSEAQPTLAPGLPGAHCDVGWWCASCRALLPPDASTEDKAAALAALVSGSVDGTPLLHAVHPAPGAEVQDMQAFAERLLNDEPLLAGTNLESSPELLLDQIHSLHILGATFHLLERLVRQAMQQAGESLKFVEVVAASLAGEQALPFRPEALNHHAEVGNHLAEVQRHVHVARLLTERLEVLACMHRLQQAQELAQEVGGTSERAAALLMSAVESLVEAVGDGQQRVAALQHVLDNSKESVMWARQITVTLKVLHAGASQHEAQVASGAIPGGPYIPPKSLGSKLPGVVEQMRELARAAGTLIKQLDAASICFHLRAQSLVSELRRMCAVNLLMPLESFVLQHMLGPRWEKEAVALLGEGSGAGAGGSAAAEQAAAEEAARRLLEEETAQEEAAARRRQQKEEKQRAAEQKRLAELAEKRRAEQEEHRRAAAERQRQEAEAAERQRAAEEVAAKEAALRQRAAMHAAAAEAGLSDEEGEEEEESGGEEEGGAAAPGERRRKRRARGGEKERRKREARKAQEAAAAAAVPGFGAPAADKPPSKIVPAAPAAAAAAPSAVPATAATAATAAAKPQPLAAAAAPAKQQPLAAAAAAPAAAAPGRSASPEQQQQAEQAVQPKPQSKQQPDGHQQQQQQLLRPHDKPLPRPGSSGSVGSAGGGRGAGGSKQTSPAVAADGKPRILTVVRPKARQSPEPSAGPAAAAPAAEVHTAPAAAAAEGAKPAAAPVAAAAPAATPAVAATAVAPAEPLAAAAPLEQSAAAAAPVAAAEPVAAAPAAPAAAAVATPAAAAGPPAVEPIPPAEPAAEQKPAGPTPGSWAALAAKKVDKPAAAPAKEHAQQEGQAAAEPAAAAAEPAAAWPELGSEAAPAASPARVGTPEPAAAAADSAAGEAAALAAVAAPAPAGAAAAPAAAAPAPTWGKPGLNFLAALAPEQAEVAMLALPGLRNEAGEFNCFLNVVLQCLWRCADFRSEVLGWAPEVYRGDGVLKALHGLFCELTALDMQSKEAAAAAAAGGSAQQRRQRPVIDPTPLREALNALPSQEFKMGEMSDAGELLLVLYEHIKAAAPAEAAAAAVDRAFGLHIAEAVRCRKCGRVTQEGRYTQHFYNVPAAALRGSLRVGTDPGFGARLRALEDSHKKTCDTDVGGCGAPWPVSQELQDGAPPRIFTLQLVWESHNQEPSAIGATLRAVGETVDLSQLYAGVPGGARYRLRSLACYYGRHYSAFVRLPELHDRWVMFDDASASAIGAWADVRRRCEGGRIQPSVLFYEAEFEQ